MYIYSLGWCAFSLGHYKPREGRQACSMCQEGQYQDNEGEFSCKACPAGQYMNSEGKSNCVECEGAWFVDCYAFSDVALLDNTYSTGGARQCLPQTTCTFGQLIGPKTKVNLLAYFECMSWIQVTLKYRRRCVFALTALWRHISLQQVIVQKLALNKTRHAKLDKCLSIDKRLWDCHLETLTLLYIRYLRDQQRLCIPCVDGYYMNKNVRLGNYYIYFVLLVVPGSLWNRVLCLDIVWRRTASSNTSYCHVQST